MLIQQIEQAVWELMGRGPSIRANDIIICFSQALRPYVVDQMHQYSQFSERVPQTVSKVTSMMGCEVNEYWPFNEIVVYHKHRCCYDVRLLVKITIPPTVKIHGVN